jgi:hypothetical protein
VSGSTTRIELIRSAYACAGEAALSMCRWVLITTACASSGVPSENVTPSRRPRRHVVPPSVVSIDRAR